MTRGRNANHAYLVTKGFLSEHGGGNTTPEAVMATILTRPGNEPSATHQLRTDTTNTGTLHQLHAIRHDLVDHEHTDTAIAAIDHAIQHLARTISINPPTSITNTIGTPTQTNQHQWATTAHARAEYQGRWALGHPLPLQIDTPRAAKND